MKIFIRTLFATIFLLIEVDAKRKVFMTRNITVEANPSYINESYATSPCEVNTRKNPCPNVPAIYLYVVKQIRDPMLEIETRDITTDSIIVQQVLNGIYASSSFPTSPTYDILVNFFTINRPITAFKECHNENNRITLQNRKKSLQVNLSLKVSAFNCITKILKPSNFRRFGNRENLATSFTPPSIKQMKDEMRAKAYGIGHDMPILSRFRHGFLLALILDLLPAPKPYMRTDFDLLLLHQQQ
ncbi:CLUMA_CG019788, isoform A [Clunio marinus]|uniref:CLUMA_CG019788, isoform A n=1 Tax=Clunio marinus TaxID=568069 RepID=A0A1J1J3P0_9DIPT|nr:CLUMA_CG019788, isoform A [Clunio marinus]